MLNVTPGAGTDVADLHILDLPSGARIAIDLAEAGDAPGFGLRRLQQLGVDRLDLLVISHFHWDHYNLVKTVLEEGLKIKRVVCSVPQKEVADAEKPWGCNFENVQEHLREFEHRGIPWSVPSENEVLWEEGDDEESGVRLRTLCCYDGLNSPVGRTDVNDTSVICRLNQGPKSALFTGDLNHSLGAWLAANRDVSCTFLKVPHHGTEGCAPNTFFAATRAEQALVPSPKGLWLSDRSARMRNWFQKADVAVSVAGIDGDIEIIF